MSRYIIRVNETCGNPEFAPDEKLQNGIDSDGLLLLTMKNGKPQSQVIQGMSTMDLALLLSEEETEAGSTIGQAIAIAEGLKKARKIERESRAHRTATEIAEMLRAD